MAIAYAKPWLSIPDQIQKLKAHGLLINDEAAAGLFLEHINYYRFSGYALVFQSSPHCFHPGTTFDQIRSAYEFDRTLRDLVTEALETIELDLRTVVAYSFGQFHGAFGHTAPSNFYHRFDKRSGHAEWLEKLRTEINRSSELFIGHFRNTYKEYPDLPIWVATEIMSFGALSRMVAGMERSDQKPIAARYHLQPSILASWIHHLVYIRNLCAHHARLWDRVWTIAPELPAGKAWAPPLLPGNSRLFATLLLQNAMLRYCTAEQVFASQWRVRVESLLAEKQPDVTNSAAWMGLPGNWRQHPLWN